LAKAREASRGGGWATHVATAAGGFAAGALDQKMGVGSASAVGVGAVAVGYWMGQPLAVNVGVGMLVPAIYRQGATMGAQYIGTADAGGVVAAYKKAA
jgi:hypothetical protein